MKKIFLSISLISFFVITALPQSFSSIEFLCDTCDRDISFRFESTSFLKNNEYFNDFSKGYTGIGFFAKPTIEYYLTKNTKATAGIYLLKYSGIDNFTQTIPIFSIQHKLTKNLELVFGSIYGALNHQIEEPVFRFDRYYQNNVEYGVQLLYNSSIIESDLWLNWEKFIFTSSPYQEEFVFGNNTQLKVYQSNKLNIYLPIQLLISHKGGQIDSSPDPVASIVNGMTGINLNYKINKTNKLGFEPLIFIYQGWGLPDSGINSQAFKSGKALYFKINYKNKNFDSMLGYWSSDKFIAPRGEYLFQSVSDWNNTFSQDKRKLITAKIEIMKSVSKSVKLILKADAYYDVMNLDFAHSVGLYFVINESFFISNVKVKK
ncbi:MAG: hypothetical protein PF484_00095 [Bacteroidales bacterium]|jgi:hypothetical protein|nr:hypothetical protein [Bacteroidales bacterium]